MTATEIISLLTDEDTYELIEAALKEADRRSYENPEFCYCVAVYADKEIEIREHLGNTNARYMTDGAIAVIGRFSRQFWRLDVDGYDDKEQLFSDLKEEMTDEKKNEYCAWITTALSDCDDRREIVDESIAWIEAHDADAWFAVEHACISNAVDAAESDGAYYQMIDQYIDDLKRRAEEE